jgi:hypothetical protein
MAIERDEEILVWSNSEADARRFFGVDESRPVRIVKDGPQTDEERRKYNSDAKLFAIKALA